MTTSAHTTPATRAGLEGPVRAIQAFYLALSLSLVLYVYRVVVAGVNLSVFRALLLGWMAWLALDVLRGRVRPERRYWPYLVIAAAMALVNVVDFVTLSGFPALRRDIANHLLNVVFAGLVLVYVDTEPRRVALLRAFMASSVVTSAITLYSALYDRLPFEWLIRTLGSEQTRSQTYISDDTFFERATAAFFDPNFYGIYSLLVLVAIMYLWLFNRPARHLAAFFALNLFCLSLTLSRTAVVGTLAALGITFLLARRSRLFTVAAGLAVVALLYASTTLQSHAARESMQEQVAELLEPDETTEGERPAGGDAAGGAVGRPRAGGTRSASRSRAGATPSLAPLRAASEVTTARVADGKSIEGRLSHIRQGLRVFRESPIWGNGSAALLGDHTQWASAHVSVLTLLARYGLIGTAVYLTFLLWPLWVVWRHGASPAHRYFVTVLLGTLMVVYLGYDILLFFDMQYLFFGMAYSIAAETLGRMQTIEAAASA